VRLPLTLVGAPVLCRLCVRPVGQSVFMCVPIPAMSLFPFFFSVPSVLFGVVLVAMVLELICFGFEGRTIHVYAVLCVKNK